MSLSTTTQRIKALADSNRIRILKLLEIKPLCVCEITSILQLATSTVSKHLSLLREAGFIIDQKDGKWIHHQINGQSSIPEVQQLLPLLRFWLNDDTTVCEDREKIKDADRTLLCSTK